MRAPVEHLAAIGNVTEALKHLRQVTNPSLELKVLRAELEALASHRELALDLATSVASSAGPAGVIVRALAVAGRLHYFSGNTLEGRHQFDRAVDIAAHSGDAELEALALGGHIQSLLRFIGLEAAVGGISRYRKAAIRSGKSSSLAALHRTLAEAELKGGRRHRALRELELSGLHVEVTQDQVALAQLHFARSAAEGLLGDHLASLEHAKQAVTIASDCGATAILQSALVNVAHCQTVLGHHREAEQTFARLEAANVPSVGRELIVRSNQLLLATAQRDEHLATAIDSRYGPIAADQALTTAQWYKLQAVEYHLAFGRAAEAITLGRRCIAEPTESDRDFLARTEAATAEALAAGNEPKEAATLLWRVASGHSGALPEFLAAVQRVGGRLSRDSASAAFELFARSGRLYASTGHIIGSGEALHAAATLRASRAPAGSPDAVVPHITTFYQKPPASFGRVDERSDATPTTMPEAVASAVRASAAMVDLTSRPALAGYELLSLAAASGAAASAVMFARGAKGIETLGWVGSETPDLALHQPSDDCVTFVLGNERDREVSVVVRPRNQQSARTTLIALQRLVTNGLTLHRAAVAESEKSAIWPEPLPEQQLGFVCVAESMLELMRVTRRVAASHFTVLVTGETGTGKELLARAIHNCSPRAKKPFTPFNCTAVPREMLDSQLFGYKRGAFTGALDNFPGVIRGAAGGTLFLDEIGEIGMDVQPKLLRFLESSDVHPLGESAPVSVDVRIVAATNANLDRMVADGRFRDDLYYRLNVVKLTIPPLRERREEIPLLLDHFLERSMKECSKAGIRIGETAAEFLLLYDWPGNVRELANEVRRAVALAESGAVLMPEHLSARLAASRRTVPVGQRPPAPTELLVRRDQPLNAAVEHVERALIQDALRIHGNVEDAARALGLSRKGLYLKRQRLRIDEE
ncbi:MAG: sigma 54-interacting transcriptional regulator [Acidobacteria bacterium]|nr:sigma 54-interacting transcriptional regulator [Acidobacteriota bacterium]